MICFSRSAFRRRRRRRRLCRKFVSTVVVRNSCSTQQLSDSDTPSSRRRTEQKSVRASLCLSHSLCRFFHHRPEARPARRSTHRVQSTSGRLTAGDDMLKIGFLGAGKMAQALAKGFLAAGEYTSCVRIAYATS